jgi:hypothetical protein
MATSRYAMVNEFEPTPEQVERAALANEIMRLTHALAPKLTGKAAKKAVKARKAQFKLDAWKRAHLNSGLNRYKVA